MRIDVSSALNDGNDLDVAILERAWRSMVEKGIAKGDPQSSVEDIIKQFIECEEVFDSVGAMVYVCFACIGAGIVVGGDDKKVDMDKIREYLGEIIDRYNDKLQAGAPEKYVYATAKTLETSENLVGRSGDEIIASLRHALFESMDFKTGTQIYSMFFDYLFEDTDVDNLALGKRILEMLKVDVLANSGNDEGMANILDSAMTEGTTIFSAMSFVLSSVALGRCPPDAYRKAVDIMCDWLEQCEEHEAISLLRNSDGRQLMREYLSSFSGLLSIEDSADSKT